MIFLGIGIGYVVAEAVGLATSRRTGTPLQVIGALGVVLAYFARNLIADDGNDPRAMLRVYAWANFNRTTASPFSYQSEKRRVSAWGADNGRLFREEIALAVEGLAVQIIDATFPTASAALSVPGAPPAPRRRYR